jgi:hypothetical protein
MKQGRQSAYLSKWGFDANDVHQKTSSSLSSFVPLIKKPALFTSLINRISQVLHLGYIDFFVHSEWMENLHHKALTIR